MKKLIILFLSLLSVAWLMQSCNDHKTYAERLKEEKETIKRFISKNDISVISMDKFEMQDSTTLLDQNQYVDMGDGVYMQVLHEATGDDARFAKTNDLILVRCREVNLATEDTIVNTLDIGSMPDEFRYTKTASQVLGQFVSEYEYKGTMQGVYGTSVPAGWLMPLTYLKLSDNNGSNRTRVNLIVSSQRGQAAAIDAMQPYFYELVYQFSK